MANKHERKESLYKRRIQKELAIPEEDIRQRMNWEMPILSTNHKCTVSLDLPVLNCNPTKVCAEVCYASQGRQLYRMSVIKSLAINRMISEDPERVAYKMVKEAAGHPIRLAGSGEILPEHRILIDYIQKYGGSWWGFTRRVDTHRALSKLMFSIDAATPAASIKYAHDEVNVRRRAYLRRPRDSPSPLEVAVTFPVHGPWTNHIDRVPHHRTDCPAVRKEVEGCWQCQRCY